MSDVENTFIRETGLYQHDNTATNANGDFHRVEQWAIPPLARGGQSTINDHHGESMIFFGSSARYNDAASPTGSNLVEYFHNPDGTDVLHFNSHIPSDYFF